MGRRAWIIASSEFVSHRVQLGGVYATASRERDSVSPFHVTASPGQTPAISSPPQTTTGMF
jgi:hypothetical protein